METKKKSYSIISFLILFVFCLFLTETTGMSSSYNYGFATFDNANISFVQQKKTTKYFSDYTNTDKNDCVLAINNTRLNVMDDTHCSEYSESTFVYKEFSQDLVSYIQNYSCDRVIHPPLEELGVLLI
jgi:hypothetical protein